MDIFVVTAYRWGWRNGHSYVVGVAHDKLEAVELAEKHVAYRGGKYGCEVVRCDIDESIEYADENDMTHEQIAYVESPYYGQAGCPHTHCNPADINKMPWAVNDQSGESEI